MQTTYKAAAAYDVVVVGAGVAGIAAALAAARRGHKTALVEKIRAFEPAMDLNILFLKSFI